MDRIFASTLDKPDVAVMQSRIESGDLGLWSENVFEFDFLNDDFGKLSPKLRNIIADTEKRKKLIFLINPPYGEATTGQYREHKGGVKESKTKERFENIQDRCCVWGKRKECARVAVWLKNGNIYAFSVICLLAEF